MSAKIPQNSPTLQGYAPAYQLMSDFQFDEANGLSGGTALNTAGDTGILIYPAITLPNRKVYAYIYANPTAANNYWVKSSILFFRSKSVVGTMPLNIANQSIASGNNALTSSVASLSLYMTTANNVTSDALFVYLKNPVGTQPPFMTLYPIYLKGVCDEVRVNIDGLYNVSDVRIYLAMISSLN